MTPRPTNSTTEATPKVVFTSAGAFRRDLDEAVDTYFAETGLSRYASRGTWIKTTLLLVAVFSLYFCLVVCARSAGVATGLAGALGIAMALVGFNVQHDGGHRALSRVPSINRAFAFSLDLLGGSSYFWKFKHNIAHHTYPNVAQWDDDIYIGALGRLAPAQRRYSFHRVQFVYMWLLYGLLVLKWWLLDDFRFIAHPGVARTHVPRPGRLEHGLFWAGKVTFFGLALGVPLIRHTLVDVLLIWTLVGLVTGLVLGVIFQLAHCVPQASYALPDPGGRIALDWSAYQVESAADFAQESRLLTWLLGGLNFQIEHHLYPRICHTHYPQLAPLVRGICSKHRVSYKAHRSLFGAIRAHASWLRQLGAAEDTRSNEQP